ncbi:MAG: prephenate dehydrogenase/arogenate dehydrogenase family protein [Lachnospiraceae bacterium]|nr:prephenate dehydrogenase/arogenate dehydrogenase family protein [Lachnospiraceae bacterium]
MKTGIIGLGLLGGSIAKAIRRTFPDSEIIGMNRSSKAREEAKREGVIDLALEEIGPDFLHCDYIFLCAPVEVNIALLKELAPYAGEGTILTDVGSVKDPIHRAVSRLLPGAHFIGGHPMAGKEKVGYANSSAELINGCYYYLTRSMGATEEDMERMRELVATLGCRPVPVEPSEHDYIVAGISHVPHVAAYMLVKLIMDWDTPEEYMKTSAAGGFKDTTRIASSDPTMWEQIFLENRDNILKVTDRYIGEIKELKAMIEAEDREGIHRMLSEIRDYRNSLIR